MYGEYNNIKIKGIAAVAPEKVIDNMDFAEKIGNRRARKQVQLTGIKRRHMVSKGQSASDMCCVAAEKLLTKLQWERDTIRAVIFVTQSADLHTPSTAMVIQKRLKIGQDCIAFDVNLGCTGYVSGLQIISAILNNTGGRGLLLVGDGKYAEISDVVSTDSLLFGDGASATAIEVETENPLYYSQKTDGTRHGLLSVDLAGNLTMDGNAVLLFSLNEVSESITDFKNHFHIHEDEIDYYILHQAQKIILDGIANECHIEHSKILTSYEEYGNTSTATLPITICHNAELLKQQKTVKLFLSGFGVGLAWSNVVLDLETEGIMPIEISNYCYNDIG